MVKIFLIICFCLLILISGKPIDSLPILDSSELSLLSKRQDEWPNWSLPGPFKNPYVTDNLIYPEFFKGEWQVYGIDLADSDQKVFRHFARFDSDQLGRLSPNRAFNAKSLGKEIFGKKLIDVIDDPNSPKRQLAIFEGNEYLETKVVGVRKEIEKQNTFLIDELDIQIFHSADPLRINQVETLSRFSLCKELAISLKNISEDSICGEQWQAVYKAPGEIFRPGSISTNHFFLLLLTSQDQMPADQFLIDLASQRAGLGLDDH